MLKERCAGIGESAPIRTSAVDLPTLWRRDDWRFAVARAVLAISQDEDDRFLAIRHLLYAPVVAERLGALRAVQSWPKPGREFAPDLAVCLDAADRSVVREALIALGLSECSPPTDKLERLIAGGDAELASLARKLMKR